MKLDDFLTEVIMDCPYVVYLESLFIEIDEYGEINDPEPLFGTEDSGETKCTEEDFLALFNKDYVIDDMSIDNGVLEIYVQKD